MLRSEFVHRYFVGTGGAEPHRVTHQGASLCLHINPSNHTQNPFAFLHKSSADPTQLEVETA